MPEIASQIGPLAGPGTVTVSIGSALDGAYRPFFHKWENHHEIRDLAQSIRKLLADLIQKANPTKADEAKISSHWENPQNSLGNLTIKIPDLKLYRRLLKVMSEWKQELWFAPKQLGLELEEN